MKTLSVYCLGTSHEQDERWSIMRALYDLDASTALPHDQMTVASDAIAARDHYKVIFDGPDVLFTANQTLRRNAGLVTEFMERYKPDRVCLFGHSRGAVLATLIAAESFLGGDTAPRCTLWLLDIVAHTHIAAGRNPIPRSLALTAYANVDEIVRVVMEDEYNPPFVFPLEEFTITTDGVEGGVGVPDHVPRSEIPTVRFIRMPGAHGNGTQVNPIAEVGDILPIGDIHIMQPGTLWPIGEVCLIHALDSLDEWGVPLTDKAQEFRGADRLLDGYARILTHNNRRVDGALRLNDVDASRAGEQQKASFHSGERSSDGLRRYGENLQFNSFIVNERHEIALVDEFGDDLVGRLRRLGEPPPIERDVDRLEPEPEPESEQDTDAFDADDLAHLEQHPDTYSTVVHSGDVAVQHRADGEADDLSSAELLAGLVDAGGHIVLVPDVLVVREPRVYVVSESPFHVEVDATVEVGGVDLHVLLQLPQRRYSVRKSDSADWPLEGLLTDLGLAGTGLSGLAVSDMRLSGSMLTGAFDIAATIGREATWRPSASGVVPLTLEELSIGFGTYGGLGGSYAAVSATARIGDPATSDVTGSIAGSFDTSDESWRLRAELDELDPVVVLGALGWSVDDFPDMNVEAIVMSYDSATGGAVVSVDVDLSTPLLVGSALADFARAFGGASVTAPAFLDRMRLTDLDAVFRRDGGDTVLELRCGGHLGFDLDDPDAFPAPDLNDTPRVEVTATFSRSTDGNGVVGVSVAFDGLLSIGGDDPVDLSLHIESVTSGSDAPPTARVVGVYQPDGFRRLDLAALAGAALGLPTIDRRDEDGRVGIGVGRVVFAWQRGGQATSHYLLALDLIGEAAASSDIPVVGPLFGEPGLSVGCTAVAASAPFARDDIVALNAFLADTPLPEAATTAGFSVVGGRIDIGAERLALDFSGADDGSPTPEPVGPGSTTDAPSTVKWLSVQRSFGPAHLARVGIAHDGGIITFLLDASVSMGGMRLTLDGLGVSMAISDLVPHLELAGIGLTVRSGAITVSGRFVESGGEYVGSALISSSTFSIVAYGALGEADGQLSMFVYAALNRPFGGPPAFNVKGLAAGFGYNRDFIPPSIESVPDHPFLTALSDDAAAVADSHQDPQEAASRALADLASMSPPKLGAYWLAAGVRFDSFKTIESRAVLLVRLGEEVEILLIGTSSLTLPKGAARRTFVRANMALTASVKPDAGVARAEARLTDGSYVIDPIAQLRGGFAFSTWFGRNPHAGDFVVSLGGYHPSFRPPAHYPSVPRLELSLTKGSLSVKAQAYLALTPSCVMAGGRLEAVFREGGITAVFVVNAHFLMKWNPLFYKITVGVSIRAEYVAETLFGPVRLGTSLGADVELWGPELAGTASISWSVISFDVEFGAYGAAPAVPVPLTWPQFRTAYLPANDTDVCSIHATAGLLGERPGQSGSSEWVVSADAFRVAVSSVVPASRVGVARTATTVKWVAESRPDGLGIQPMGTGRLDSDLELRLVKRVKGTPTHVDLGAGWLAPNPSRQGIPKELWNFEAFDAAPSADMLPNRLVGFDGLQPRTELGSNNPDALDVAGLALQFVDPARTLPLADELAPSGPAVTVEAGGVFGKIRSTIGEDAERSVVIAHVRAFGFLADSDAEPVTPTRLAAEVENHLASAPLLGNDVLGGTTSAVSGVIVERPTVHPDFTSLPPAARLAIRLLAQITTQAYRSADGVSQQRTVAVVEPLDGDTHMVVSGRSDPEPSAPLRRELDADATAVLELARSDDELVTGTRPTVQLRVEGSTAVRVVELDRFGAVLSDADRLGSHDIADRVAVLAVSGRALDAGGASGWHGTSTLVPMGRRSFMVDGGVVTTQHERAQGFEPVRAAAAVPRTGWVRTSLPAGTQTVVVYIRRSPAGETPGPSTRVQVRSATGDVVLTTLTPRHVVRENDLEVALMFQVPPDISADGDGLLVYEAAVSGRGTVLNGVVGHSSPVAVVRRDWAPGTTGLAALPTSASSRRSIELAAHTPHEVAA